VQSSPLRIVSIGGGTGLSTLLRGLKRYAVPGKAQIEITAVVTVTDDGGSSGRLRRELDVLPPGDIRNCMVALAQDETLITRLFQYRFSNGNGLKGHSFGNLFLTAMTHLTGDFARAVKASAQVLPVLGRIYPATLSNVALEATLADGTKVSGETRISRSMARIERIALKPRKPKPLAETLSAIANADLITFGPGSLFTSVIPNLLVEGVPEAIAASPALKAYFMNLMWQPGETGGFRASDHVRALLRHCGRRGKQTPRDLLDVCVVNTGSFRERALYRYQARSAQPVENDIENLAALGIDVLATNLIETPRLRKDDKIRHDPAAIAGVALELARQGRRKARRASVGTPDN
jgi:uncharacterized cofD-like protein